MANMELANARQIQNNASNRGQALGLMSNLFSTYNSGLADSLIKIKEANDATRLNDDKFNFGINTTNSDIAAKNAQLGYDASIRKVATLEDYAKMRDLESTAHSQALSNSTTAAADAWGNVGLDNFYANQADAYMRATGNNSDTQKEMAMVNNPYMTSILRRGPRSRACGGYRKRR